MHPTNSGFTGKIGLYLPTRYIFLIWACETLRMSVTITVYIMENPNEGNEFIASCSFSWMLEGDIHPRKLTNVPWKGTIAIVRGKACLPIIIFQGYLKFRGCKHYQQNPKKQPVLKGWMDVWWFPTNHFPFIKLVENHRIQLISHAFYFNSWIWIGYNLHIEVIHIGLDF